MNDALAAQYGEAVYQVEFWIQRRDYLTEKIKRAKESAHSPQPVDPIPPSMAKPKFGDNIVALSAVERKMFSKHGVCFGGRQRIASRLGFSLSYISSVSTGQKYNREVLQAFREEIADACQGSIEPPLTKEELALFAVKGSPFWGMFTSVARTMRMDRSVVSEIACGRRYGPAVLLEIRRRMAFASEVAKQAEASA
jgi:hypothetical protein